METNPCSRRERDERSQLFVEPGDGLESRWTHRVDWNVGSIEARGRNKGENDIDRRASGDGDEGGRERDGRPSLDERDRGLVGDVALLMKRSGVGQSVSKLESFGLEIRSRELTIEKVKAARAGTLASR